MLELGLLYGSMRLKPISHSSVQSPAGQDCSFQKEGVGS